eukprot:208716_1
MSQSEHDIDNRLNKINDFMEECIRDNTINNNIKEHTYISPIQHHKSSLTLHSIIIHKNINQFQYLFPNLENDNIYLKKVVILRILPTTDKYSHVLDISPYDLLSHIDNITQIFNKFNIFKYDYSTSKSFNNNNYQQYLYSHNYIQDLIKNKNTNNSDLGFIITLPSNLYININYKYNMILIPKYYQYNKLNNLVLIQENDFYNIY